jgi:hypothetical protein
VGVPLRVIRAGLIRVAYGYSLHVGLAQEVKHDSQALRAHADKSNVDLVAGGHEAGSAQHIARHNGEGHGCTCALPQELATADAPAKSCAHGIHRDHLE